MKEKDFVECKFINENMQFITYTEFCKNRVLIKKYYNAMGENGRLFYKWYIYANIHMKENFKNAIWNYLNGYDINGVELIRISRFYKPL